MNMFYGINKERKDGKVYLFPNSLAMQSKFLIQCDSQPDADKVVSILTRGPLAFDTPYSRPEMFTLIGYFGETEVYRAKDDYIFAR